MKKLIKSAKDGSYEAMMALGLKAIRNRLACQAFFCVMEENLKFDTASIQDMKRGRLPLVPSLDPKDALNISCNSMLVLATSLRNQFLFHPVYFTDWTSSMVALMPAISFWLCLFCEHIILPSRTSEFTFIDFHRAVVFILAWAVRQNKIMMEPKLFTDYLPFLWFHPPPGCTKYDLDDARALFAAIDHWLLASDKPQRHLFVSRLEENTTLTSSLVVQFIVDEFAHIPEESDMTFLYQSFLAVTSSTLHFACESLHIHTALLKNNILKWMCLAFRFVTRRVRFTYVTLVLATRCVSIGLVYIVRVIHDGHSYIHQLLGYDFLLYMMKALHNLHDHPDLTEQEYKTSIEEHTVTIVHRVISHLVYASILKRSKKAISKIQRQHVDGFLNSEDPGLKQVCKAWTKFVNIASYRSDICSIPDSFCGNSQCPGTSVGKSMACSGCQSTRYCSRTCQKNDWSSGAHRSLCTKIKQLRTDGAPLPVCLSDSRAFKDFDRHYTELHWKEPSKWDMLLKTYIAENGEPDPLWPMLWVLDYRAVDVKPHFNIESSELRGESLDPEMLAKARDGTATLVYCIVPDGQHTVTGLYMKQWVED
ncbi:hypothetical protein EDD85DRAFT_278375 [Armillaria nabsnona]|nr:hypothetical protein EDD85DRAFT_278375 [Armillaria nabsnona]